MSAPWFPRGCVASPHHLASSAGAAVLAAGGNAVDAAVAANLVLGVVTPYHCGVGGDLLAIVWDGRAHTVMSIGAAPMHASVEAVTQAIAMGHGDSSVTKPGTAGMPTFGALAVTVPGAVAGWFHLLERWGTRSFGDLAGNAVEYAKSGFTVSPHAAAHLEGGRQTHGGRPRWLETFGRMTPGETFRQPELAATLGTLAADGPDAFYRGSIAERIVATLSEQGSSMTVADFAEHRVSGPEPLSGEYRDITVLELPPPTQGFVALHALGILDHLGDRLPDDQTLAAHLQIEAIKSGLTERQQHLGDPDTMRTDAATLLAPERLRRAATTIDQGRASSLRPTSAVAGGTAYLCAADANGLLVSLIQSNFVGFGSGVVVPGTGIGLHNRGAHFSLDPSAPNAIGPGRQPMHTLIPALALRDEKPWCVFGTMGGDGQPQIHVQLLGQLVDRRADPQAAVDAARWHVEIADGALELESDAPAALFDGLRSMGHTVRALEPRSHRMGHAHAIVVTPAGYVGGSDPRCEGGIVGL